MPAAYARPSEDVVVVSPASLPELARQTGETMFMHETIDGRTLLYIERDVGAGLAILDVTDPSHVKAEGTVRLDAPGTFYVTRMLGERTALVQFQESRGYAVLDFRSADHPRLKVMDRQPLPESSTVVDDDGVILNRPPARSPGAATESVDTSGIDGTNRPDYDRIDEIKGVRSTLTIEATGTTLLLADDGLHVVRRPSIEFMNELRRAWTDVSNGS